MELQTSTQECPFCNRIVQISHEDITLLQHDCGVVLQRNNGRLIEKPIATIQHPIAIIQKGTAGRWNGKSFRVSGRFRAWMNESVYNYWTIIFDDSSIGYLAEGYGIYAIYRKSDLTPSNYTSYQQLKVGEDTNLKKDVSLILVSRNECYRWEMEGEIYIPDDVRKFRIYEFAGEDSSHVEAMVINETVRLFDVFYVPFATLELTNTRNWEPHEQKLICGQCSKPNVVITFPFAQSYACKFCGAKHKMNEEGRYILDQRNHSGHLENNITIGASGIIKGVNYEVIGYALKQEVNEPSSEWKEYTLFNPEEGYAFLSEYNGHWIYVRERGNTPVLPNDRVRQFYYGDESFTLFNRYNSRVRHAIGEFPSNIFNDTQRDVKEFISPPEMWIYERSDKEGITWFLGEHISRKELQAALGDSIGMPYKVGVGAVEPKGFTNPGKILLVALVASLILMAVHFITTLSKENRVIISESYALDSNSTASFVTPRFELDKRRSNLEFEVEAPVSNSWFELTGTLVNVSTGTEYTLEKGVEYYHGVSEGESWAEGSSSATGYLSEIPKGTYYLQINGNGEPGLSSYMDAQKADHFSLEVKYDVSNDRNLGYCLLAFLILPAIHFIWVLVIEKKRWENSPLTP